MVDSSYLSVRSVLCIFRGKNKVSVRILRTGRDLVSRQRRDVRHGGDIDRRVACAFGARDCDLWIFLSQLLREPNLRFLGGQRPDFIKQLFSLRYLMSRIPRQQLLKIISPHAIGKPLKQ